MRHDVFISYRRDGGEHLAGRVKDALKSRGFSVFMDVEDLKSGRFDAALFRKIEEAMDVIVILTPGCLDRCKKEDDWLRQEIRYAIQCKRNVVPILARGFEMPSPATLPSDIAELVIFHGLTPAPELFEASIDRLVSTFLMSKTRTNEVDLSSTRGGPLTVKDEETSTVADDESESEWLWLVNLAFGFASLVNLSGGASRMSDIEYSELVDLVLEPCQNLGLDCGKLPSRGECSTERILSVGRVIEKRLRIQSLPFAAPFTFFWQFMLIAASNENPLSTEQAKAGESALLRAARSAGVLDSFSKRAIRRLAYENLADEEKKTLRNDFMVWARSKDCEKPEVKISRPSAVRQRGKGLERSHDGRRENQALSELKKAAEVASSVKERSRAIRMIGHLGGRSEIPWLTKLIFRTGRQATIKEAIKQIVALGGVDGIRSLKDIAENHKNDGVRGETVELIPQLDKLSDPDWLKRFMKNQNYSPKYRLLEALAKEGWLNRLDISASHVRQFIEELRQMAETEEHPDIRHKLICIVAHLCKNEPWTREWVLQRAREAEEGYYRIHGYAIGLSVWNSDETFVQALNECPKDASTGQDGKMFVRWAKEGDWKRYRFHMGGWGPTM